VHNLICGAFARGSTCICGLDVLITQIAASGLVFPELFPHNQPGKGTSSLQHS
jgi:hypothetical protein